MKISISNHGFTTSWEHKIKSLKGTQNFNSRPVVGSRVWSMNCNHLCLSRNAPIQRRLSCVKRAALMDAQNGKMVFCFD